MTTRKCICFLFGLLSGIVSIPVIIFVWPFFLAWFIMNERD